MGKNLSGEKIRQLEIYIERLNASSKNKITVLCDYKLKFYDMIYHLFINNSFPIQKRLFQHLQFFETFPILVLLDFFVLKL